MQDELENYVAKLGKVKVIRTGDRVGLIRLINNMVIILAGIAKITQRYIEWNGIFYLFKAFI